LRRKRQNAATTGAIEGRGIGSCIGTRLKVFAALVAIALLPQSARAANVQYFSGQQANAEATFTFFLTGYNANPNAEGELSLVALNVISLPPLIDYDQAWYSFSATVGGVEDIFQPLEVLESDTNGYAETACRYEYCSPFTNFMIPTGALDIALTVTVSFIEGCLDPYGGGACTSYPFVNGTPAYELELEVPDGLCLTATPLPAGLPLFATGLLIVGLFRRKSPNQDHGLA
jgi:hypothetical protein